MLTAFTNDVRCNPVATKGEFKRAFWRQLFKILGGLIHF